MFPTCVRECPTRRINTVRSCRCTVIRISILCPYRGGKVPCIGFRRYHFRVLLIELIGDELHHETQIFTIADELRNGTGDAVRQHSSYFNMINLSLWILGQLFDYIAQCIFTFLERRNLIQYRLPLGFTFSFPCKQEGLSSARLTNWTKGLSVRGGRRGRGEVTSRSHR